MKPNIILPALLVPLLLGGCKDDISLPDQADATKLVVYCFPSTADTTWISVSQSLPVRQYHDNVQVQTVSDARISYTVNGELRPIVSMGSGRYYVVGQQRAGDEIALTVEADGRPTASAHTTIPDAVAIGQPRHRTVSVYDDDANMAEQYDQLMATFTDPKATTDYYAVRVVMKNVNGWGMFHRGADKVWLNNEYDYQTLVDQQWDSVEVHRTDSTYYYVKLNTKNEPLLAPLTQTDRDFGFDDNYYGLLYIFDDTAIGGTYTLHLNVDENDIAGAANIETDERMELLHLSPEYYKFLKSVNAIENSDLARYGLSQIMPTASNVSGGLGVVGGWNMSHTNWINSHIYEEP